MIKKLLLVLLLFATVAVGICYFHLVKINENWVDSMILLREESKIRNGANISNYFSRHELDLINSNKPIVAFFPKLSNLTGIAEILLVYEIQGLFFDDVDFLWFFSSIENLDYFKKNHPKLNIEWVFDKNDTIYNKLNSPLIYINSSGDIYKYFYYIDINSLNLSLLGMLGKNQIPYIKKEINIGDSIDKLQIYSESGRPIIDYTGYIVFLSINCMACDEWITNEIDFIVNNEVMLVFSNFDRQNFSEEIDIKLKNIKTITAICLNPQMLLLNFPAIFKIQEGKVAESNYLK